MPKLNWESEDQPEAKNEKLKESKAQTKATSKAKITIEDACKPAIVNAFLAWVTKLNPEDYPRDKAVINQCKQWNKGPTLVQLLDLFQIFLETEMD